MEGETYNPMDAVPERPATANPLANGETAVGEEELPASDLRKSFCTCTPLAVACDRLRLPAPP